MGGKQKKREGANQINLQNISIRKLEHPKIAARK
jgi:hypothetical protein